MLSSTVKETLKEAPPSGFKKFVTWLNSKIYPNCFSLSLLPLLYESSFFVEFLKVLSFILGVRPFWLLYLNSLVSILKKSKLKIVSYISGFWVKE